MKDGQLSLFGDLDQFTIQGEEWKDMPEYKNVDIKPYKEIIVRFEDQESVERFAEITKQNITSQTKSLWYPEITIARFMDKRWKDEDESQ